MVEWKIGHSTLRLYIPSASPSPAGPMRRGNEDWTQSRGVYSSTEEISLQRTEDPLGLKRLMLATKDDGGSSWDKKVVSVKDDGGSSWGKKDRFGDDGGPSWSKKVDAIKDVGGSLWGEMRNANKDFVGMSPPVHHKFGERRLHYGPKGTRAYAHKPYYDAWGNMVPDLFPNAHIRETTVRRQVLMPHFQRAAEYRRMYQGHGTFQFAPEVEMTPPKRGRGCPR
ncbi:LOW QUALITY PROTEIN: hypothetical protein Bca4012_089175 [Brassica carinata]